MVNCLHSAIRRCVSLPENVCLWAGESRGLTGRNIKHLAGQIRRGNWASWRMPAELTWIACDMTISRRLTPTESNSNRQNALRFNGPGEYPSLGLPFLSSVSFPHVQYMPT